MAETTAPHPTSALPTSSKTLCVVYALIAIAALIATWSQNVAYFDDPAGFVLDFGNDTRVNPASRSITADILLFTLAAAILMVIEARKHDIKFVWAYILGSALTAISITFPLFLIARELRIGKTDPTSLRPVDTIALAVLAVGIVALTIWVDMG